MMGARAIVISSSDEKLERARALGASDVVKGMAQARIRPQIAAVVPFDQAPVAFEKIKAGGTFGKVCVTL